MTSLVPNPYRRIRAALHPIRAAYVEGKMRLRRFLATWRIGTRLGWTQNVTLPPISGLPPASFRMNRDGAIPEMLRLWGEYEAQETDLIRRLLTPGMTFLDVGANAGYFSLLVARSEPAAQVYAFEPCRETFALLTKNIRANALTAITALNVALSDVSGMANMQVNIAGSEGLNTLGKPVHYLSQVVGEEVVACSRLDDVALAQGIMQADLMKVDVEGAEMLVFQGAHALLSREDAPLIVFELSRLCERGFGHSPAQVLAVLETFGYTIYTFRHGALSPSAAWDGTECSAVAVKPAHRMRYKSVLSFAGDAERSRTESETVAFASDSGTVNQGTHRCS